MPLVTESTYSRPPFLFNRHLETIFPAVLRNPKNTPIYERERISTPDGDFLDLDWANQNAERLVVISHGLEGNSQKPYIQGMGRAFYNQHWDVLAWNYRGCSGELNKTNRFYHSGATEDLEFVITHAVEKGYHEIVLVGFSLGGNLTLKYLGEKGTQKFDEVKTACVFSVPIDLAGCANEIAKPHNFLYSMRFLRSLNKKVRTKLKSAPNFMGIKKYINAKSVYEFDDNITAPLHGFESADDYYEKCSARSFISTISVPALVVNALNDPFLSESCFEKSFFEQSDIVYFETPHHGGHVGFSARNKDRLFWSENRALKWVEEINDK